MVVPVVIIGGRFIFVHVPKTGGQSVAMALGGKTQSMATHTPLRCVEKGDRFAFGFARNPWERMVSLYRFMCQKPFRNTDNFDQEMTRRIGFKRWLMEDEFFMQEDRHPTGEPWVMRENWRGDGATDLPPMQRRPQMWWLRGCDFIGRFENLPADFAKACSMAGLQSTGLPHINATTGGNWRAEYDAETRDFVAEHFAEDIEAFGFECPAL